MDGWAERQLFAETRRLSTIVDATVNTTQTYLTTTATTNPVAIDALSNLFRQHQELLGQQLYRVAVLEDLAGMHKAGVFHARYAMTVCPDVRPPEMFTYWDAFWVVHEEGIIPLVLSREVPY